MSRKLTLILPGLGVMALMAGLAVTSLNAQTAAPPAPPASPSPPKAPMHPHMDPAARFAAKDTNKDGFIDKTEATGALMQRFDEIDTDKDGKISLDELKAAWKGRMAHARAFKHGGIGPKGPANGHPMMGGGDHLAMMDTDKDGKISWDEMSAAAKAHFDALDVNHDGYIDASEMPKGPKVGHMKHKARHDGMTPAPAADKPEAGKPAP